MVEPAPATAEPIQSTDPVADPNPEAPLLDLTGTPKEPDETPKEPAQEEEAPPIEYDLKLPEDSLIDDAAKDHVLEFAKQHKLPNEVAQEILNQRNEAVRSFEETRKNEWNQQAEGWKQEIKANKEIGGDHLEETRVLFTQAMRKYAPDGFIEQLEESQMLYHPMLVQMMRNIGKDLQNASFVPGSTHGTAERDNSAEARAQRMFGSITQPQS